MTNSETTELFDENAPLSEDELQRLEHNALAMVAREYFSACPQCEAEAPLIVRAVVELRRARSNQAEPERWYCASCYADGAYHHVCSGSRLGRACDCRACPEARVAREGTLA